METSRRGNFCNIVPRTVEKVPALSNTHERPKKNELFESTSSQSDVEPAYIVEHVSDVC